MVKIRKKEIKKTRKDPQKIHKSCKSQNIEKQRRLFFKHKAEDFLKFYYSENKQQNFTTCFSCFIFCEKLIVIACMRVQLL